MNSASIAAIAFVACIVTSRGDNPRLSAPKVVPRPHLDITSHYVHDPGITVTVVSLTIDDLLLECHRGNEVWRERYAVTGGKIVLAALIVPEWTQAKPPHLAWKELPNSGFQPALDTHGRPVVLKNQPYGAANSWPISYDPRWNNFGKYMKELVDTVQVTWDAIVDANSERVATGSVVTVKFKLNSAGQITVIKEVKSSPGTSEFGTRACSAAITNPAPSSLGPTK